MRPVRVFVAERGNAFMRDIASWIAEAAEQTGREATVVADGRLPGARDTIELVVAPHEFYALGHWSDRAVDHAVRSSVPVCTEQPGTTWFDITSLYAGRSPLVLDINAHGTAALRDQGIDTRHLRLGGVPSMDHRRPNGLRSREALFLGGRTDRRARRLAELAPLLAEARRLAANMGSVDPAFLAGYKRLIDEGYAASFGEGLAIEHRQSSAANSAVRPAELEARRAAVQARGRTQG